MTVEARRVALHDKAARLAFRHYLCSGRVPLEVREVLAATESLAALEKYDPNQPRVPRGSPRGGADRGWSGCTAAGAGCQRQANQSGSRRRLSNISGGSRREPSPMMRGTWCL